MPLTNAQKQADYRTRVQARHSKVVNALHQIADKLEGRTGALAIELRAIAMEGLA